MNTITFNFESTKFLGNNLLGKQFTLDDYRDLINSPEFADLTKKDLSLIKTWQASDKLFEEHTIFIMNTFLSGRQMLGIEMWLSLFERIEQIDPQNYQRVHKGTGYYHAGIYSLFSNHYDDAYQWFEYAFEQDIKTGRFPTPGTSSLWILLFDPRENQPTKGMDYEYTKKIVCKINQFLSQIKLYDSSFTQTDNSIRGIVKSKIVTDLATRSLRSAWSSLLASLLEYSDVERSIKISPRANEAQFKVNKFLVNLTLILETLIKKSPKASSISLNKGEIGEIYEKIVAPEYSWTYDKSKCFLVTNQINKDYSTILGEIKSAELVESKLAVSFTVAQRVRNASHHIFNEELITVEILRELSLRIYYAIFSVIEKLYV